MYTINLIAVFIFLEFKVFLYTSFYVTPRSRETIETKANHNPAIGQQDHDTRVNKCL